MSKAKSLKKSLPDANFSFSIELEGNVSGQKYEGNFAGKMPNIKAQAQIAKHRAMLNAGLEEGLDVGTKNMHHMLSYLRYTLDKEQVPKWWKDADLGYDLYDPNVVETVYEKVLNYEKEWLEAIWGKEEEEPKAPKGTKTDE